MGIAFVEFGDLDIDNILFTDISVHREVDLPFNSSTS